MGTALDQLVAKLAATREVWVPPHLRRRDGKTQKVDGHFRTIDDVLKRLATATGSERNALLNALGRRAGTTGDEAHNAPSTEFGMGFDLKNRHRPEVVEAKKFEGWDELPTVEVDLGTERINATEKRLVARSVNKVAQLPDEERRPGYVPHLVRASDGQLYVVDGHHRVAASMLQNADTVEAKVLDLSTAGIAAQRFKTSGGFSLRLNGKEPPGGIMVAMPGTEETFPAKEMTLAKLRDYMDRHREVIQLSHHYFGGWLDRSSGTVYLDISRNVKGLEKAKKLGKDWGQLAVFDIDKAKKGEDGEVRLAAGDNEVVFLSTDSAEEAWADLKALIEGDE